MIEDTSPRRLRHRFAVLLAMVSLVTGGVLGTPAAASAAVTLGTATASSAVVLGVSTAAADDGVPEAEVYCEIDTPLTYAAAFANVHTDSGAVNVWPYSEPDKIIVTVDWVVRGSGAKASNTQTYNTRRSSFRFIPGLTRARDGSVVLKLTVKNNQYTCTDQEREGEDK